MSDSVIHQVVHGYEHGHSLLAGSIELDRDDLDLVGRLSDLSGALGPESEISPYLSVYPLPSRKFVAVARTWPDASAPRSGCVLTHTILIPPEEWMADNSPNRFAAVLRAPDRATLADYSIAIRSVPTFAPRVVADEPLGDTFVQRYFGEGLAPIAWFGAVDPESAAWCVINALWPSLRARFACCTLALQPRTLGDRPFDLVFAPQSVFSRFVEFARDHVVDGRVPLSPAAMETWFRSWSSCVFEGSQAERCKRVSVLSSTLEPHPTAIRRVLFFLELQERAEESPTAALGAFDLLETLAPLASQSRLEKHALAAAAMQSIKSAPTREAQELVYLLCSRLQAPFFAPEQALETEIRRVICRLIKDEPEERIREANSLAARHAEAAPSLFIWGVSDAVIDLLESECIAPSLIAEQQTLMERLVAYSPEIPALLLRSSAAVDRERIISSIVDWCRAEQAFPARPALRRALLPEVTKPTDAPLVEELLRDVGPEEVPYVCSIVESHNAFRSAALSGFLGRLVGERQPSSVRQWARTHSWSSYQCAALIAASYPSTADGLSEFYSAEVPNSANQSLLLAAFIERASALSPPSWLLSFLETDLRCWELLLTAITEQPVGDVVIKLIRGGLRRSTIARPSNAARMLGGVVSADSDFLREYAVRQLLADYVEGLCDIEHVKHWLEESWVVETLVHLRADAVSVISMDQLRRSDSRWTRAWNLVGNLPDAVVFRNEIFARELIAVLLQTDYKRWTAATTDNWQRLLSRVSRGDRVQVSLCGQALHFALEHRQLPLAAVVAESFYPVHDAAMRDKTSKRQWLLWGFADWDKAKDLRRSLVDSFLQSKWPPSHFALAAREPWLLRKLCKRMLRQWKGHQFLESSYSGLKKLSSVEAQQLLSVLHQIVQNPEIVEEWD